MFGNCYAFTIFLGATSSGGWRSLCAHGLRSHVLMASTSTASERRL